MEWFLLWIGLAIVVGVAANTRGRSGFGWFFLAVLMSPLIAGLLVLALGHKGKAITVAPSPRHSALPGWPSTQPAFEPEGVLAGVPYRRGRDGSIEAMMSGGLVRFRSMEQFSAAANGRTSVTRQH